jgi:hypothetical protein
MRLAPECCWQEALTLFIMNHSVALLSFLSFLFFDFVVVLVFFVFFFFQGWNQTQSLVMLGQHFPTEPHTQ